VECNHSMLGLPTLKPEAAVISTAVWVVSALMRPGPDDARQQGGRWASARRRPVRAYGRCGTVEGEPELVEIVPCGRTRNCTVRCPRRQTICASMRVREIEHHTPRRNSIVDVGTSDGWMSSASGRPRSNPPTHFRRRPSDAGGPARRHVGRSRRGRSTISGCHPAREGFRLGADGSAGESEDRDALGVENTTGPLGGAPWCFQRAEGPAMLTRPPPESASCRNSGTRTPPTPGRTLPRPRGS